MGKKRNSDSIKNKINRKIHGSFLPKLGKFSFYYYLYSSFRHYKKQKKICIQKDTGTLYYSQQPNTGAGIGHQIANWNAGYWFAMQFGLKYAYSSFSSEKWDSFLGFGEGEVSVEDLRKKHYKVVLLPPFSENVPSTLELTKKIIASYAGTKTVFLAELDTGYRSQIGVESVIKHKFNCSKERIHDKLIYNENCYNIAVHIRRGDIIQKGTDNSNLSMRWLEDSYYYNILKTVKAEISIEKIVKIYIFSQGRESDFAEMQRLGDVELCLDMSATDSFLHMIRADMLLTSRSSFSYKPALLSDGIRICPKNFWHDYPDDKKWILVADDGVLSSTDIENIADCILTSNAGDM